MARKVEEPAYVTVIADGDTTIRDYPPGVVAETQVTGEWDSASNQGFRRLAGYIFGGNAGANRIAMTAPVGQKAVGAKIAMTAPVGVRPADGAAPVGQKADGTKIAMTAPVGVRPEGDAWVVSFTMPSGSSLKTLPVPNDARVILREKPGRRVAVNAFSGFWTDARMARHTEELRAWIAGRGLHAAGPPEINRYDPPWTLPWRRRNEIWIEVVAGEAVTAGP